MADDVVPDRRTEELRREARRIGSSRLSDLALISADEVERLIAEVERLREKNDRQVFYGQRSLDVAEEVVALRGALQALVDATEEDWATIVRARARAVGLLNGDGKP